MAMKAYWCGGDLAECVDLIFAETASKARYYSYTLQEASCECELIEITVKRSPQADYLIDQSDTKTRVHYADAKTWREIGGGGGRDGCCISCGKSPMTDWWPGPIDPKWALCPECDTCGECGCECEESMLRATRKAGHLVRRADLGAFFAAER